MPRKLGYKLKNKYTSDKISRSITFGYKVCNNCFELKEHKDFAVHKSSKDGRRPDCNKCKAVYDCQRRLEKKMEKGFLVKNCIKCDLLYSPMGTSNGMCQKCRKS